MDSQISSSRYARACDARRKKVGLTLLELMVVLVILAIVATTAIQSLQPRVDAERIQQSASLLEQVQTSVVGPIQKYQVDGTPLLSGFVSDIGRLPLPTAEVSAFVSSDATELEPSDPLRELWDLDSTLAVDFPFRFRQGPSQPVDYSEIRLPCGWRGPYMNLAPGTPRIIDPWGRTLETLIQSDQGIERVGISLPNLETAADSSDSDDRVSVDLRNALVNVTGTVLVEGDEPANAVVTLLAPLPQVSLSNLVPLENRSNTPATFLFEQVPVGLRAVVADINGKRHVKYVQVPHSGLNVVIDLTEPQSN